MFHCDSTFLLTKPQGHSEHSPGANCHCCLFAAKVNVRFSQEILYNLLVNLPSFLDLGLCISKVSRHSATGMSYVMLWICYEYVMILIIICIFPVVWAGWWRQEERVFGWPLQFHAEERWVVVILVKSDITEHFISIALFKRCKKIH